MGNEWVIIKQYMHGKTEIVEDGFNTEQEAVDRYHELMEKKPIDGTNLAVRPESEV